MLLSQSTKWKVDVYRPCVIFSHYHILKLSVWLYSCFLPLIHHRGDDFYLHLAWLSFPNPSVSRHSVSNLLWSFALRWTGTWQSWWLMRFRLTLTLCMHPRKSVKRSISTRGDKVICHPWQQLIFSGCSWHFGTLAPLPQTTANCAVLIVGI